MDKIKIILLSFGLIFCLSGCQTSISDEDNSKAAKAYAVDLHESIKPSKEHTQSLIILLANTTLEIVNSSKDSIDLTPLRKSYTNTLNAIEANRKTVELKPAYQSNKELKKGNLTYLNTIQSLLQNETAEAIKLLEGTITQNDLDKLKVVLTGFVNQTKEANKAYIQEHEKFGTNFGFSVDAEILNKN